MDAERPVLLTGATGHVGGRLLRSLEELELRVRCLTRRRRPDALAGDVAPTTAVARADVLEPDSLADALAGGGVAYYLVHSLASTGSFAEEDRRAAENFAAAAREAGVERIVYLGGLGRGDLSDHLASRQEVGEILRSSGVPTIEFRASIVVGSGSLSFELVRSLVDNLPVLVLPHWLDILAQPIALDDLVAYLVAALHVPLAGSRVYEIGGADRVPNRDVLEEYARQRGSRRAILSVPVRTPPASSGDVPGQWLARLAPERARAALKLVESLRFETTADDGAARETFAVEPMGLTPAVERALADAA